MRDVDTRKVILREVLVNELVKIKKGCAKKPAPYVVQGLPHFKIFKDNYDKKPTY